MQLATTLLLFALQGSQFEPPVTVRCQLDTELPLDEIRVSIAEMREREGVPEPNGSVTFRGLPAGDIHVLKPKGVGVVVEGVHQCMTTRGIHKPGVAMITSQLLGHFRSDSRTRAEFLNIIGRAHLPG